MTSKITYRHSVAGAALYAVLINEAGAIYNGSDFEVIADANWGNYDIPLVEAGSASQIYQATFPPDSAGVSAGVYSVLIYEQAGASPAVGDSMRGAGTVYWDGSAESAIITTAAAQAIADELLKRGVANVEDTADPASLAAIILATLESSISGATWTIRKTGGTTFVTKTVTTDPAAEPITGVT